jgi:hypothetical protein
LRAAVTATGGSYVDKYVELIPETRKEWIAPELSKVDIKKITAAGAVTQSNDSFTGADS